MGTNGGEVKIGKRTGRKGRGRDGDGRGSPRLDFVSGYGPDLDIGQRFGKRFYTIKGCDQTVTNCNCIRK